jgi:hypothetical protein
VNNLKDPRIKDGIDFLWVKDVRMMSVCIYCSWNNGDRPYLGITINTCQISPKIKYKNIILIDDIYAKIVIINIILLYYLYRWVLFRIAEILKYKHIKYIKNWICKTQVSIFTLDIKIFINNYKNIDMW